MFIDTARGLLAMLNESRQELQLFALLHLNNFVHQFWPEVASSLSTIESFYPNEESDPHQRQMAALLASKPQVFYYLNELNDSLSYALNAGALLDVSEDSGYIHTLCAKAIDMCASLKSKTAESNGEAEKVDPRLKAIVETMLNKCILDGEYQQAIGIAIECRRLDIIYLRKQS